MTKVVVDISMSLDGYVTGPDADSSQGLGRNGQPIQGWVTSAEHSPKDAAILEEGFHSTGAVIMGRRTFDFIDGSQGWEGDRGYGYEQDQTQAPHNFVITHRAPQRTRHVAGFTFVTGGISSAISQAAKTAGDKEVVIMGGADVAGQALALGAVDELRVHLSPVLMGSGTRLFDHITEQTLLTQQNAVVTPYATHLTYRVDRAPGTRTHDRVEG
ncbi:DNA-binding protein [Nocardiopsis sp. TSRI0078]|uniref:dihydrofolate reductase family protein n=1 Tax=unclassified Nocardiopsis TaxID=2649073 RepID=UPI00093F403A|nr:dihydrofolate reductase family protein [Nocardiopsis sp. TSRI0078]OKI18395.1 DNA-binding protein [Nocardiopsis sp. TSRI0078]